MALNAPGYGYDMPRVNRFRTERFGPWNKPSPQRGPGPAPAGGPRRRAATGFAGKWESYGNRVVQTQSGKPGSPSLGSARPSGYAGSAAGRDPVSKLASVRRSIDAAGKRFWGKSGPPPSTGGGRRSRFQQFNPTGRPYGSDNPKRLSYRRFTSKWRSGGPGQLLQPNFSYMGGSGDFDPGEASRMGMGRMPGAGGMGTMRTTYPRYNV